MSCAKCERPFRYGTEDTVTINKKTYHADCLSCDKCSKPYDGSFSPDDFDREALCRDCNHTQRTKSATINNTEPKNNVIHCGGCGLPFNPTSRHITKRYHNKEYHYNCLKCQQCQSLIEGEIYEDEQENKIYCTSCFKLRDQQSFQKQNQEKKRNQQKTVHFAEKLAETLNRDELEAYYKNDQGRINDPVFIGNEHHNGEIKFCALCMSPFHSGSRITQSHDKEYHYECFRCEKCSQPINGTYTMSPDGLRFKCGNCLQKTYSSSMKLCNECGQPIEPNIHSRIDFSNNSFHAECFTCALCHRRLNPSMTFTLHNGQPWCHQCEIDTKNCFVCSKPIFSAGITYETRDYHAECFKCSNCHKSLDNEKLLCANNLKPYCVACNDQLFAKRCNKCRQPISHDTRYTIFNDKPYHEQCFTCAKCNRRLNSSMTCTLHNDQPWCHQCEIDTKNCFVCGKPILSAGITYETRDYHAECFKCSNCHKSLDNEKLLCANNLKPYCVACNDQLFAKRCNKCGQPISHDTRYTVFDDKPYHEQCFLCAKCHRPIGSKKFYKDKRGFICSNCGNS